MILHGLAVPPMIRELKSQFKNLLHIWFADDGNAGGKLQELKWFFICLKKVQTHMAATWTPGNASSSPPVAARRQPVLFFGASLTQQML